MEGCSNKARASARAVLSGGEPVTICEAERGDEPLIGEFLAGLGLDARRLGFFTAVADVGRASGRLAAAARGRIGVIALDGDGAIMGHALGVELAAGRAEFAVAVRDGLRGQGLAEALLEQLSGAAARCGVTSLRPVA